MYFRALEEDYVRILLPFDFLELKKKAAYED
jgi:hypothetical protein